MEKMKEVKINIPDEYVIDRKNSTFDCIKFKKKNFPKTWEEFCDNYPVKDDESCINADCEILKLYEAPRNPIEDANVLPNKEYAEAMLALCQLIQLRDCYNDGWQPNWKSSEIKYSIIIEQEVILRIRSFKQSRLLVFKTEKIRDEFYTNFKDIIEKAKILL